MVAELIPRGMCKGRKGWNTMNKAEDRTDRLEQEYATQVSYEYRKKLGQFFTPQSVAEFMCRWILNGPEKMTVLDPAVGLGIFIRTMLLESELAHTRTFTGYDVDVAILKKAREIFSQDSALKINLCHSDYLNSEWDVKYDGIICNPPYIKFHDYAEKKVFLKMFKERGMSLSGLTNLYSLFLLKSLHQLRLGGRMAYIIPSEFLNADFGQAVKYYLKESGLLRFVIVVDFGTGVFQDVLTTSCILLLANDNHSQDVTFYTIHQLEDLKDLAHQIDTYPRHSINGKVVLTEDLEPNRKWRKYYQDVNQDKYRHLVPFSRYAKVSRGIATGANDYFTFSENTRREYQIPENCLLPCLVKAQDAPKSFFTLTDYKDLVNRGKTTYLFDAQQALTDTAVQQYLRLGEEQGIDQRYLTRHRKPWYTLENRKPAPILVTVFNRSGLRFVRNEAMVYNLTTFHCVYLNEVGLSRIDLLMAYLITDVAQEIFADDRREYGRGLHKFEPNDLNNSYVVDLEQIELQVEEEILKLYSELRLLEITDDLKNPKYEKIKNELNKIFRDLFLITQE